MQDCLDFGSLYNSKMLSYVLHLSVMNAESSMYA